MAKPEPTLRQLELVTLTPTCFERAVLSDGTEGRALFSADRVHRYSLMRIWEPSKARICFLMLNPSIADAFQLDPTVRRCVGYAQRWGYGSLEVVNLFALRSTDPRALYTAADPVGGPHNDDVIKRAALGARFTIAAWGAHGAHLGRGTEVCRMLRGLGIHPYCLATTKDGHPRHPLYLKADLEPAPYEGGNR